MSGNVDFFSQTGGYRTRGSSIGTDPNVEGPRSNPATVQFRQKAANYVAILTIVSIKTEVYTFRQITTNYVT